MKSNSSILINFKKDIGGPDIVKLRLKLTLNEVLLLLLFYKNYNF